MSRIPTDLLRNGLFERSKKAGYELARESKHISMVKGERIAIIPRHKRIKRETLRGIIQDAGLSIEEFRNLL